MDIDHNTNCYNIKEINNDSGFFDNCVDATYVIHLENNGRLNHINKQLEQFHPTKKVYIAINKGFKNCNKKLIEQVSYQDLTDAFLQCFKHANERNYNNILILEDDFIFNSKIKDSKNINSICKFLNKKKEEPFIYYLGCNPIIVHPYFNVYDPSSSLSHYKSIKSCSTHGIIYSREARNIDLDLSLKHWDAIIENGVKNRYLYYKPLCYQTYPDTENKKSWGEKDSQIIAVAKSNIIKILYLDVQPEPGFSIMYAFSKLLLTIFILFVCYFIYFIYNNVIYNKVNSKKFLNGRKLIKNVRKK
jgi:hypothetical protein